MPGRIGAKGLVILDRDGVINKDSAAFVKAPAEWLPLPGSIDAIATLSRAGFTVAVASNQSGLARGLFDRNALRGMHRAGGFARAALEVQKRQDLHFVTRHAAFDIGAGRSYRLSNFALECAQRQSDYLACWQDLSKQFKPGE